MNLPVHCIHRPVMTTLLSLAVVVFGLFAFRLLPVAALPRVEFPTVLVSASLPGASPEAMAASVALPLERQLSTIAGVDSISSTNARGSTSITVQFDLGRSIDAAALDVQTALSTAQRRMPAEMTTPPSFRKINPADQPILFLALSSPIMPLSEVNEYAETRLAQRLSTLPGIAQVQVYGQQKFAVRIHADPDRLTARGMTLDDVRMAVAAANSNAPTGTLSGPARSVTLEATGQATRAEAYRSMVVAWRNGAPVRLGDVADVTDSVENDKVASWYNGTRSIVLAIQRQPDANTVAVADAVKTLLPAFQAQMPPSLSVAVLNDRSQSIRASVNDVQFSLLLSIALVIGVIWVFLRSARATLIPAVVVPISLIGTFSGMYLLDYSLDNISLLALTLAVGFVVDDAIVVLENIVRHMEAGKSRLQAAIDGSREIAFTIVSITLSLVAAFIPILFMGGVVGRMFREFAVTISLAILISGVVSLTLTPLMASRFATTAPAREGFVLRLFGAGIGALTRGYRAGLDVVLAHPRIMLLVTFATLGAAVWGFVQVQKGFFPTEDTGMISATTEAAEDIAFPVMATLQARVAGIVQADPDVASVNSSVGAGGPNTSMNAGRMFIGLKPWGERTTPTPEVIQRLRRAVSAVPGIATFLQPVQNLSMGGRRSKSQYQYALQAGTIEELHHWASLFDERLKTLEGLQDVSSDLQIKSPMARVAIDRDRAAALGVSADDLRQVLFTAYGGRQVASIYTPSNTYQVILEVSPERQAEADDLSRLHVRGAGGKLVPLDAVASVAPGVGPLTVAHQGQLPAVTFSFNLAPSVALGEAVERIGALERSLGLPPSVSGSFEGTAKVFADSAANQGLLVLAAVLVVYVVLGVLYESFVHPVTIISGLPSAAAGALGILILTDTELTVMATIGIVLLIGIVKKNAIMMVDVAMVRRRAGEAPGKAIREACLVRFRPIMMTTMAALLAAVPIALGHGAGGEMRRPLGLAVVGGLLVSQVLTLFITPIVYLYLDRLAGWLDPDRVRQAPPATTKAEAHRASPSPLA